MKIKRFHSKHFALMLFLIPVFCLSLKAQDKRTQVTGIVKNENGTAIANVSVMVKNTKTNFSAGTTTDSSGVFNFSKLPPGGGYTFTFSSVGFETQKLSGYTLQPDAAFTLVTRLRLSERALEDVIVIGYGTAKRKDVVGSLDVVPVKEAGATSSTNPSELLIGKAAGVQVVQANGVPGADAQIIIRGTGSFTGVDPLYIIDGIQADKNLFNALSTQDIENITILKDASSTAIYGSAAANGVVIITTRKGRPGPPRISITSQWGEAKAWKQLHLLDAAQYVDLLQDFAATSNTTLPAKFSTPSVLVDSNNWQSRIFRQAPVSENDINISGGSDKVLYTFSVGYIKQESIVQAMTFKRLNTRMAIGSTSTRLCMEAGRRS